MLQLRKKLAPYQERFYFVFILLMGGLVSAGFTSNHRTYQILFVVAALFLLLKIAVTDFTKRELLCMAVVALLIGADLLRNGEKTLLLTIMGIFGIKNVSLEKVLRYSLWTKVVLTVGKLLLVVTGIAENRLVTLPKNGVSVELYCYGYYQPNIAFANLFLILTLAILVYRDRLKWYMYAVFSAIMLAAYWVFMCRTGLVVWVLLLLMVSGYHLSRRWKLEKIYLSLISALPLILAILTFLLPLLSLHNAAVRTFLNHYLTGRIDHILRFWDQRRNLILGHIPREPFDSMYFHTLYNYGWIVFLILLLAYWGAMWYGVQKGKHYEVMILGIMAVYGFMELYPLSVAWNLPLLFLSWPLFEAKEKGAALTAEPTP